MTDLLEMIDDMANYPCELVANVAECDSSWIGKRLWFDKRLGVIDKTQVVNVRWWVCIMLIVMDTWRASKQ